MSGQHPWRAWLLGALLLVIGPASWALPPPPQAWQPDIEQLVANDSAHPPPQRGVLFVGSSSIRMWTRLASDFPGVPVINRGFGGSAIADSTYYADRIAIPYHPRLIVMYAGDNDIAAGDSPDFVLKEFQDFVRRARVVSPGVPIAFIAIKPSMARKALLPQIRGANAKIRDWAATQKGVSYLDVVTPMLGADGQPQPKWFREDGLHMNRSGYELWISIVKPWVDAHGR